jgi:dynein light chain LC8-type
MEEAEKELERRSKFLNSLIQNKKKAIKQPQQQQEQEKEQEQEQHDNNIKLNNIHVRACDMSLALQKHAFQCARDHLDSMPSKKVDSKHLALLLKKVSHTAFFEIFIFLKNLFLGFDLFV